MSDSLVIILVGVSGAGKSTLRDYVLNRSEKIEKLIAITDRPSRVTEIDGVDKFFVSTNEFQQRKCAGDLCLVNQVYGNMYAFRKIDLEIGGTYLGELHYESLDEFLKFHQNTISIYIKPHKTEDALQGLYSRGSSQEEILVREKKLLLEAEKLDFMCEQGVFDYTFINYFTEKSKQKFCELIEMIMHK